MIFPPSMTSTQVLVLSSFLTGDISASLTMLEMSEPEYLKINKRLPLSSVGQFEHFLLCDMNVVLFDDFFKHSHPALDVGQWDVDSFLKPSSYCRVQGPREVSSSQHKHVFTVVTHALHLDQKLRLHSSRDLVLL